MVGAWTCSTWNRVFITGCALGPALYLFFTAALRVKHFLHDAALMDNTMRPQRRKEKWGEAGPTRTSDANGQKEKEEAPKLWGMMYADERCQWTEREGGGSEIVGNDVR